MNNNNISGYDPNTGQPIINNSNNYTNSQPVKNDKSILWIILISVVIFPVLLIVFFIFVFSSISSNSNKLVCKSSEGNITIMYNESSITGYFATGIRYDLDGQKEIAKQIGLIVIFHSLQHGLRLIPQVLVQFKKSQNKQIYY